MTFKFRWGYAHEIERDVDQDGKVDQRLFLPPESDGFYHHDVPEEIWIDDDHDGRFEGRGQFDGQGILRIEIDADGDGIPELTLGQAEARKYLNERHYSPSWKREHEH